MPGVLGGLNFDFEKAELAKEIDKPVQRGQARLFVGWEVRDPKISDRGLDGARRYQRYEYTSKDVPSKSNKPLPVAATTRIIAFTELDGKARQVFELAKIIKDITRPLEVEVVGVDVRL